MVPLQCCIRRGRGAEGYITALKGISIPIINQSLLRKSRFTPVFMAGEKAVTPGSRLALLPHSIPVKRYREEAPSAPPPQP